ncbi:hypothetical protein P43SY_002330 [Pythium insidiosum]|uniref:Zeta toxin domain-containing protein n=1 Tax=Pythium insidiosum TaxID=114742 RepID=A0AAD5LSY0_PYTIN|nr:hypothetical protein P43SY_002330 [Pythium insidiosum]
MEDVDVDASDPMELLLVQRHDRRETFTRYRLQETLMLMGCRPRDAVVVTHEVFAVFREFLSLRQAQAHAHAHAASDAQGDGDTDKDALPWHYLHQCINASLARLDYTKPAHLLDFQVAKEITQRRRSFIVLLGGTSGTGKSTLASLLAARLRLTTVLPTDSVRHILRAFTSKEDNPCAFVSTYQAGDALPESVVQELAVAADGGMSAHRLHKRKVLRGYKLQSDVVLDRLDRVLTMFERRQQSLVVEGVHLNTEQMLALVKRHPTCVPFVIYISNELKHRERFAVRARHMTIDPQANKYIKYFDNIRIIQRHLCKYADKYLIPKIDNTNVDRSINAILATLVRVLRKLDRGESILDEKLQKMVLLSREHENSIKRAWSSKGMRKAMRPLIKQKVSKRLLLRRLLAEQSVALYGTAHAHGDDSSSSDDERPHGSHEEDAEEERKRARRLRPDHDADAEDDDDEEDEQTTIVGSLLSGTNGRDHAATAGASAPASNSNSHTGQIDPSSGAAPLSTESSSGSVKMMRSLSAAIQHATMWRAGQPLSKYSDWDSFVVPELTVRRSDATFSDVLGQLPTFDPRHKWKYEERRKSWMAGDYVPAETSAKLTSLNPQGAPPLPHRKRLSRSARDLGSAVSADSDASGQDLPPPAPAPLASTTTKHISFAPSATTYTMTPSVGGNAPTVTASTTAVATGRRSRHETRRVRSLPPEALDLAAMDFDLDSVSVAGRDDDNEDDDVDEHDADRVSQSSSRRDDSGISPLAQSTDDNDSHFEVSSESSNDADDDEP